VKGFFVAGTDTGVGKTQVARALCELLARRGLRPLALKPCETGCDPDAPPDALALREACGSAQPLDRVCPYRFRMPAAPLIAAEAEGRSVDLAVIEGLVERAGYEGVPIVVEAAGGLLVPLARPLLTNLDLIERLRLPVVLVARAGLGTLNHSALSFRALSRVEVAAIVLNRTSAQDDPSVESNPRWVAALTGARVLGPTPFLSGPLGPLCAVLEPLVDTSPVRR
jgi:dethiobiotin synthetase